MKPRDLLHDRSLHFRADVMQAAHDRAVLRERNIQQRVGGVRQDRDAVKSPEQARNDQRRATFYARWHKQAEPLLQLMRV